MLRHVGALLLGLLVAVLALVLTDSRPASAYHYHHNAGDSHVYFHECYVGDGVYQPYRDNQTHDIGPTDITRHQFLGCDIVDVRVVDGFYGVDDPAGWWHCHLWGGGSYCNHGESHLNRSYSWLPEHGPSTLSTVCEELGHAVGLDHRGSGATYSCLNNYDKSTIYHLDGHDIGEINAIY